MESVMCFWLKLFCLTRILSIIVMIQLPDNPENPYEFSCIPLGHSGFLVSLEPKVTQKDNVFYKYFKYGQRIKNDQRNKNFTFSDHFLSFSNQIKIHSLTENTLYEVIIQQYEYIPDNDTQPDNVYSFEMKTNQKTNIKPAKPDFELSYHNDLFRMTWYPCGKEKKCAGKEAGTHFAVKLNPLDRRGEQRIEEYSLGEYAAILLPGIFYEMTVISINNDSETESDPQEVFFEPKFGPVRSVGVELFANATISVSWKPPKYLPDIYSLRYSIRFTNMSILNDYRIFGGIYLFVGPAGPHPFVSFTHVRFEKPKYQLEPGKTYIVSIVPLFMTDAGLDTQVKFTIPLNMDDLFVNGQKSVLLNTEV